MATDLAEVKGEGSNSQIIKYISEPFVVNSDYNGDIIIGGDDPDRDKEYYEGDNFYEYDKFAGSSAHILTCIKEITNWITNKNPSPSFNGFNGEILDKDGHPVALYSPLNSAGDSVGFQHP